jgi:hypothetical protein
MVNGLKSFRKPIRVYIAGPLTPHGLWNKNLAVDYLLNVRNMIEAGKQCLLAGFSPFVPGIDFNFFLHLRQDETITEQMIKDYSIDWLLACDALLILPGWASSMGTLAEIQIAFDHSIPSFFRFSDLQVWAWRRQNAVYSN